ncbi:MAG: hypothetical protein ACHQQS_10590 [Thermoanaerobaculales bacterium]
MSRDTTSQRTLWDLFREAEGTGVDKKRVTQFAYERASKMTILGLIEEKRRLFAEVRLEMRHRIGAAAAVKDQCDDRLLHRQWLHRACFFGSDGEAIEWLKATPEQLRDYEDSQLKGGWDH